MIQLRREGIKASAPMFTHPFMGGRDHGQVTGRKPGQGVIVDTSRSDSRLRAGTPA